MAVFTYQGTGASGKRLTGEVEASSRADALRRLAQDRIQPLTLSAGFEKATPKKQETTKTVRGGGSTGSSDGIRLTQAQVILFTEELSDFLKAGLQLEPALQLIESREEKSPVKLVAARVREKVRDGVSFSEALKVASPSFGELYANLVAAGEVSGALAPILNRQSEHLIAMQDLRGRILMALYYPAALVVFGILAIVMITMLLIPRMTALLVKTGSALPWSTWLLMEIGKYAQKYGLFVLAGGVLAVIFFLSAIQQPRGRRWWDETKLKLPLFGPLLSTFFYAQFCQTMANLLQNGLPLLTSLKLVTRATGNEFFRGLLTRVSDLVGEGASLTRALKNVGYFPASLRDLMKVGEQTGDFGSTLEKIGERLDKQIQRSIDRIMSLVPIIIISALGALVALVAISMLSGIFQMVHTMQEHR